MKGWEQMENWRNQPFGIPPEDCYWDYPNKRWVHVEDNTDMTWWIDRLCGYDAGPGERLCKGTKPLSGKEWKLLRRVKLEGETWEDLLADAQRKAADIENSMHK